MTGRSREISERTITVRETSPSLVFEGYIYYYFCYRIASDMEVDEVRSRSFDVSLVWEFDIVFLEIDTPFLVDTSPDFMLRESTEELPIFSFYTEFERLTVEHFLYLKSLLETFTHFILLSFFILLDFFESVWSDFSCDSFWDERVASLRRRDLDDLSLASEVSNVLEEFDREFVVCHREYFTGRYYSKQTEEQGEVLRFPLVYLSYLSNTL